MKDGVAVREGGPQPDSGNRVVVWAQRLYPRASQAEGGRRRDAREVALPGVAHVVRAGRAGEAVGRVQRASGSPDGLTRARPGSFPYSLKTLEPGI